ncbi:MAG: hypothetical protein EOO06_16870 [Chitinophagaceae bacterium]|nr:MAG: hypothetical protein EOO06_16870 [Chitinophagaceae bacterium]
MTDPRIDAYIEKSQDFAKPILNHLRKMVHGAAPEIAETIKWGMPYFLYKGSILCGMASFRQHCSFGFWKSSLMKDPENIFQREENAGMGNFGKIQTLRDLPASKILRQYLKEAISLHDAGTMKMHKEVARAAPALPAYFQAELKRNKKAQVAFESLAPSHKKEYIKWLESAKTDSTREKRLAQALQMIADSKTK